jgi:hypothetical protein
MSQLTRFRWLAVLAVSVLVGACVTYTRVKSPGRVDRGIRFPHKTHAAEGLGCTDCHGVEEGGQLMPNHDLCGTCHDFDVDKPDPEACGKCHTNPGNKVRPRATLLGGERKFSHEAHLAKKIECDTCHPDLDKGTLPRGPIMSFCMDCHEKTRADLAACAVCHKELNKDVRPNMLGGRRISHDAPSLWRRVHGREWRNNEAGCALCHESNEFCEACHRQNRPESHTVSWRRTGHGLRATWDRQKCSVCHEEDSCLKCHKNTEPASHRAAWGRPVNRHCISCHYPPERTGCTVCHESIEHGGAMTSPHNLGLFPRRCGRCHPGGMPNRAPHVLNGTVRCVACH